MSLSRKLLNLSTSARWHHGTGIRFIGDLLYLPSAANQTTDDPCKNANRTHFLVFLNHYVRFSSFSGSFTPLQLPDPDRARWVLNSARRRSRSRSLPRIPLHRFFTSHRIPSQLYTRARDFAITPPYFASNSTRR